MSGTSVLAHAGDGHREKRWSPGGPYGGLGQCLSAAARSRGEITLCSAGGTQQSERAQMHTPEIFKDSSPNFQYQTYVQLECFI